MIPLTIILLSLVILSESREKYAQIQHGLQEKKSSKQF